MSFTFMYIGDFSDFLTKESIMITLSVLDFERIKETLRK